MLKTIQTLFVILAVFAVVVVQAVGMQAGYWCGCTGERATAGDCVEAACHPHQAHEDGCEDACGHGHGDGCGTHAPGSGQPVPKDHDHEHTEIRDSFIVTTFPPGFALPPVLWAVLPPAMELPEVALEAQPDVVSLPHRPPDDTGPPMCLLVAETTVLLV